MTTMEDANLFSPAAGRAREGGEWQARDPCEGGPPTMSGWRTDAARFRDAIAEPRWRG